MDWGKESLEMDIQFKLFSYRIRPSFCLENIRYKDQVASNSCDFPLSCNKFVSLRERISGHWGHIYCQTNSFFNDVLFMLFLRTCRTAQGYVKALNISVHRIDTMDLVVFLLLSKADTKKKKRKKVFIALMPTLII